MNRLKFDSQGRLAGFQEANGDEEDVYQIDKLKTSKSLSYDPSVFSTQKDREYWSLYNNDGILEPLKFSNGKTQEDVVKEVMGLINRGRKIIFIHGVCGTGKSVIALNIARLIGKTSIVVPVKGLQRQYEEDYSGKMYLLKKNGRKMKISMITGRDNHDSIIMPGESCANSFLPDTIKLIEKNIERLQEYYEQNPLIKNKGYFDVNKMKRIAVAPANPYWSPILPSDFNLDIKDADKKKYRGLNGQDFIFYHRKRGCSYFDQYDSYIDSDVIIFNSAKYKIESVLNRKPETEVEIIDEADEFLDNFSTQQELNLSRLANALKSLFIESDGARDAVDFIIELIKLEEKNKFALGVDENKIFSLKETQIDKILRLIINNPEIEAEVSLDELSYPSKAVEAAKNFKEFLDETYVTFRYYDKELYANLVTTNLSKKFQEIVRKSKAIVLMSGTLHSESVLKNIFGIEDYDVVEAETLHQGMVEIHKTGKEFDCKYANFSSKKHSRRDYLTALSSCMSKAKKPVLIHVNSYDDLPTDMEKEQLDLFNLMSKEKLWTLQTEDKTGRLASIFKSKLSDSLFTTKCSRGMDFPGEVCNSMIFTKYPNPNVRGTFWKVLEKTHSDYYWDFYKDKARREFLQRVYRAIRSKEDHVYVLSPDSRVLDAVREMQIEKS